MPSIQSCRSAQACARRPRRGDYVASLVEFPRHPSWRAARRAWETIHWMALGVLLVAGWGLWYRLSHGAALDLVTLAGAVGSAALGLVRPSALREPVNWGAAVAVFLVAASTPAPSDRPAARSVEIGAMAVLAVACATAAHAARDRTRVIVTRVLAALAAVTAMIQPRLAASLAAAYAAPSAA